MTFNLNYSETIHMVTEECITCGVVFGMPTSLKNRLKEKPGTSFYCPNGHAMVYRSGLTKADQEREARVEAERKLQEALANADSEKIQLESQLNKAKRDLKRIHSGVCTCCNRTFSNLKQHMETQHPEILGKPPYQHSVKRTKK